MERISLISVIHPVISERSFIVKRAPAVSRISRVAGIKSSVCKMITLKSSIFIKENP